MKKNTKKKKTNKRTRKIISTILSFLLAVIFTVGSLLVGIYIGFLNENRIIDGLNYKDYYSGVEETFRENSKDLTIPMGLPDTVLNNIVESQKIHEDVKNYVVAAVNGQTFVLNTDGIKLKIEENVRGYFVGSGLEITPEQEATIPEYAQMIVDEYERDIKVPLVDKFSTAKRKLQKVLLIIIAIEAVLTAISVFILLGMQKWKHRGVRYIVYSSLATAIMVAIPGIAGLISGFYKKMNISAEYLYYALVKYISNGLWVFLYLALVWIAISGGLLFLIHYLKENSSRN